MKNTLQTPVFVIVDRSPGSHGNHFDGSSNRHAKKTNKHTKKPLLECKWGCAGKISKELNNNKLEDNGDGNDNHKHIVLQDALKHIYFLHLSRANLIENLHKKL